MKKIILIFILSFVDLYGQGIISYKGNMLSSDNQMIFDLKLKAIRKEFSTSLVLKKHSDIANYTLINSKCKIVTKKTVPKKNPNDNLINIVHNYNYKELDYLSVLGMLVNNNYEFSGTHSILNLKGFISIEECEKLFLKPAIIKVLEYGQINIDFSFNKKNKSEIPDSIITKINNILNYSKNLKEKTDDALIKKYNEVIYTKVNSVLDILLGDTLSNLLNGDTIRIYVERTHTGEHSTTGTIKTDDNAINGYTVELPRGTDDQCKEICKAGDNPPYLNCYSIMEGTYDFEINTTSIKENFKNKSLRLQPLKEHPKVPNGRTGLLVHLGNDDAEGWSKGCILPMPNEPVKNCGYKCNGRKNNSDLSLAFTQKIVYWVKSREANIKARKPKGKIVRKIIVTKTF